MEVITNLISTVTTISNFIVFLLAFFFIKGILDKDSKKFNNCKERFIGFVESPVFRAPFGFSLILLGLLVIAGLTIIDHGTNSIDKNSIAFYHDHVIPILLIFSNLNIYIGSCIVFWPTIEKITIKIFGVLQPRTHIATCFILIFAFKLLLTVFGVITFYIF